MKLIKRASKRAIADSNQRLPKSAISHIYEKNINDLLRSDRTTIEDLYQLGKKMNIPDLRVYWLSDYDKNYQGPQILNLGSSSLDREGTHWVCAYRGNYFDSFGIPPPPALKHLDWVPLQKQDISEGRCGQWCLMFIWYMNHGELDKFYKTFKTLN
jgi:hypothetical protein